MSAVDALRGAPSMRAQGHDSAMRYSLSGAVSVPPNLKRAEGDAPTSSNTETAVVQMLTLPRRANFTVVR
jgi:hypothetical protein